MQDYFNQNGLAYQKFPPHNPDCEKIFKGDGPRITSPLNGSEYYINTKDPEPLQLTATPGTDANKLYWYINDQFYKTTGAKKKSASWTRVISGSAVNRNQNLHGRCGALPFAGRN